MPHSIKLYDYFRSTASYRLRIALNLKGLVYEKIPIDLRIGEQRSADYLKINPQGLVPALQMGSEILTQSLAIIEYLNETSPEKPFLPKDPLERAKIRSFAYVIAEDIHPINNLRVLNYLRDHLQISNEQKHQYYHHWLKQGFDTLEEKLKESPTKHAFCFGDSPSLADICLIPQIFNAQRFHFDLSSYSMCLKVLEHAHTFEAFVNAYPKETI
jgi:maleylacetoacetate isomerase